MKLRSVVANNRKARLELTTRSGTVYPFPYSKLDPRPTPHNRIHQVFVDRELGNEAVTFVLESGDEGSVHIDHALEYNQDPTHLGELLLHKLTVEARRRMDTTELSRREIARRLRTSLPQLYRLIDPGNMRKSIGQLVALLQVLDCEVDIVIKAKSAA